MYQYLFPAMKLATRTAYFPYVVAAHLAENAGESFIDNVIRDTVIPCIGSVLHADLLFTFEHSGIYVGNGEVVELNGNGVVQKVSLADFMGNDWKMTAISVYVSSCDGRAVGSEQVAQRALEMVGSRRNYNPILNNCHQFSSGCLTGDFENSDNFLRKLKETAQKTLGANERWRVWNRVDRLRWTHPS